MRESESERDRDRDRQTDVIPSKNSHNTFADEESCDNQKSRMRQPRRVATRLQKDHLTAPEAWRPANMDWKTSSCSHEKKDGLTAHGGGLG
jgi:hypothetical protein